MSWVLKILDAHWRVFGLKKHHKHLSQMGHEWMHIHGYFNGIWYRNYICKHCNANLSICRFNAMIRCDVYYEGNHTELSCEELRMDNALT